MRPEAERVYPPAAADRPRGPAAEHLEKYIGEVVTACSKMTRLAKAKKDLLYRQLQAIARAADGVSGCAVR